MLPRKLWAAVAGAPLALLALVLLATLISSTGKNSADADTPGSDCTVATAGNGGSGQADGIKLDAGPPSKPAPSTSAPPRSPS